MTTPINQASTIEASAISPFEVKLNKLAQLLGFYSVNYFFSVGVLVLMYPVSEKTIAPLLSAFLPISQCTLIKAVIILTIMYWLPILWDAVRRWYKNDF
jgi:hypothetical protein